MDNQEENQEVLSEDTPYSAETEKMIGESNTLRIIGMIILILGLFCGLILFLATFEARRAYSDPKFNPMCFAYAFAAILPSITIWAFLRVVANISKCLAEGRRTL